MTPTSATYDSLGRRTASTDAAGLSLSYSYNALDEVTGVSYPPVGSAAATTTWIWDSASRTTGYSQSAIGQGIANSYDAESRRTQMGVGPGGGTATWTTQYGYDEAGRLSTILDSNVSATSPFTYAYQNGTNWISGHYQYDPFGNLTARAGSLQQAYQWSSKEADTTMGIVYYLYRFYSPGLGRWLSRDPTEEDGGFDLYEFDDNAAIDEIDPLGEATTSGPTRGTSPHNAPLNSLPPSDPGSIDNTFLSGGGKQNNTAFFNEHYPGWVAHEKTRFTDLINSMLGSLCQTRPGTVNVSETDLVTAMQNHKLDSKTGQYHNLPKGQSPNETLYGDSPQSSWEASKVLGDFTFGLAPHFRKGEAQITWTYAGCCSDGTPFYLWSWTADLLVYDRTGLQSGDSAYKDLNIIPGLPDFLAPNKLLERASWPLTGSGKCKCGQ